MKDMYILGIESSCDETSASIVKNGTTEIATVISSQIDIHKSYGGVVPEIASREHVKNITIVLEECLEKANMTMEQVDADRKSTRLNSSHVSISYAVFCLKKKKKKT
mgnify:CR=1 FL=1